MPTAKVFEGQAIMNGNVVCWYSVILRAMSNCDREVLPVLLKLETKDSCVSPK